MEEYIIEFYGTEDGFEPAREFIESLDAKLIAKIIRIIELLARYGPTVRLPNFWQENNIDQRIY